MGCSAPDDVSGYRRSVKKEELVLWPQTVPVRYRVMQAKYKCIIGCLILILVIMFFRGVLAELNDDLRHGVAFYGKAKEMANLPVEQKVVLGFPSDQSPRFVYAYRRNARYFWTVVDAERDTVVKWIERVCQEPDVRVTWHEVLNKTEKDILASKTSLRERDMPYLALDPEDWQRDIEYWRGRTEIFYNPATKQVLFSIMEPIPDLRDVTKPFLYLKRQ